MIPNRPKVGVLAQNVELHSGKKSEEDKGVDGGYCSCKGC